MAIDTFAKDSVILALMMELWNKVDRIALSSDLRRLGRSSQTGQLPFQW